MNNNDIHITNATKEDAQLIARTVVEAVGEEITDRFAGEEHSREDVTAMFAKLASREDSQYSYLNSIKAVDADGNVAGILVSYDGGRLDDLRKAFFEEARNYLDYDLEGKLDDETCAGELYLDSLCVFPDYRRRGIARMLIDHAVERAHSAGLKAGLLVDKKNASARRLYETIGFRQVGETPFAFELMDHLQL